MIKRVIKRYITYFWNGIKICRFKKFGKGSFIGKRLILHTCRACNITIGDLVSFGSDLRLSCYESSESKVVSIDIQDGVYGGNHISILTASNVTIEKNVLLASYINILGENHSIDPESESKYGEQPLISFLITIREGAWIGQGVTILTKKPGLTIGKKSVIGAGSVVTKDVPDYSVAIGNPAKVIKMYNFKTHAWEKTTSNR